MRHLLPLATCVALALLPGRARASTLEVCETCTFTTPADAVDAAAEGDVVQLAPGVYRGPITADVALTLRGPAVLDATGLEEGALLEVTADLVVEDLVLRGDGASRPVRAIHARDADLTLRDVEVTGFALDPIPNDEIGGAGLLFECGRLVLERTRFHGNASETRGGHVHAVDAVVAVTDATFEDGAALYGGGALQVERGDLDVARSTFTANDAGPNEGGAIDARESAVRVDGATFSGNRAARGGALAFHAEDGDALAVLRSTFEDNRATSGGAAIHLRDAGAATLERNRFVRNAAGEVAGAVTLRAAASAFVLGNRFCGNTAEHGVGALLLFEDGAVQVLGNVFSANLAGPTTEVASWAGAGAVHSWRSGEGGHLFASNVFLGNALAPGAYHAAGGGLYLSGGAPATVANQHFVENAADGGGALAVEGMEVTVVNGLFVGNTAASGGGVHVRDGTARLTWSAWWDNLPADADGATLEGTHLRQDPGLGAWSEPCAFPLAAWTSAALHDAGDPALRDADGSRSDVGAFGGPHAGLLLAGPEAPLQSAGEGRPGEVDPTCLRSDGVADAGTEPPDAETEERRTRGCSQAPAAPLWALLPVLLVLLRGRGIRRRGRGPS